MTAEKPKTHCILVNLPDFKARHGDMNYAEFGEFMTHLAIQITSGRLTPNQLARISPVVRDQFNDDGVNLFLEAEIARAKASSERQRAKVEKRWAKPVPDTEMEIVKAEEPSGNTAVLPQHNHGNTTGTGTGTGTSPSTDVDVDMYDEAPAADADKSADMQPSAKSSEAKSTSKAQAALSPEFNHFWAAYPATGKQRSGRAAAWQAWRKSGASDKPELAMQALEAAKKSRQWQQKDGEFVPGTHLWLNRGSWQEAVESPPSIGQIQIASNAGAPGIDYAARTKYARKDTP